MAAEPRGPRKTRRPLRMYPLRLLLDVMPELLVEQRALSGAGRVAAGHALGQGFARRGHWRAARQSRGPVPALSLPHHHELRQGLPEEPQSFRGNCRTQAEDGRAADLDAEFICKCWPDPEEPDRKCMQAARVPAFAGTTRSVALEQPAKPA